MSLQSNGPSRITSSPVCLFAIAALSLSLSGCDVLFDHALDCLDSDGPTFDKRTLTPPVLNQEYSEILTARIENEPRDDQFIYDFDIFGALPEGITWRQITQTGRQMVFEGTPTELGTFEFTATVAIDEPGAFDDINSGLCYTTRSRKFELVVQEL